MKDKIAHWIARHSPRRVAYWCYITVHAEATTTRHTDKTPFEVDWLMALDSWEATDETTDD